MYTGELVHDNPFSLAVVKTSKQVSVSGTSRKQENKRQLIGRGARLPLTDRPLYWFFVPLFPSTYGRLFIFSAIRTVHPSSCCALLLSCTKGRVNSYFPFLEFLPTTLLSYGCNCFPPYTDVRVVQLQLQAHDPAITMKVGQSNSSRR